MCRGRLEVGEAPACVQSCPHQAIRIVKVRTEAFEADPRSGTVLPGITPPEATRPTTVYKGGRPEASRPADADDLVVEHAHAPLAALLVLTQWGTGLWLLATLHRLVLGGSPVPAYPLATSLVVAGLVVGAFHLGRPERAWKAFLGWRRSWFSREVLAFGNAVPLCMAASIPVAFLPESVVPPFVVASLPWAALGLLVAGAACSTMLYMVTPRPAWARPETVLRFALTLLGGGAVVLGTLGGDGLRTIGVIAIATGIAKVLLVGRDRRPAREAPEALHRQARLLLGPLARQVRLQRDLFLAALASAAVGTALAWPSLFVLAAILRLGSDMVERTLFFRACPATRMPGGAGHA
jgi:DMSO reductase anchor subunit